MNESLESILYITHDGDKSKSIMENIHIYTINLIFNILNNNSSYKKFTYYKKSKAFRLLCDTIKSNLPKSIFIKDGDGYIINTKHKKYPLYVIFSHSIKYALIELGF